MHAAEILQTYLDRISLAVLACDWEAYRSGMSLPCHIISHDENIVVETEADLRAAFDQFCNALRIQRVTDYIRLVESATQLDQNLISGRYVTHLIAGSYRVVPPTKSEITLRLVGERWCAVSLTNGLNKSRWPLAQWAGEPEIPTEGTEE